MPNKHAANEPDWLVEARRIAEAVLWPRAQQADQAAGVPIENIRVLAEAGLLGVNVPREFGGQGGGLKDVAELFEVIGSGCGLTIFVALQHMLACSYVAGSTNHAMRERWLPELAAGGTFATVAFSQLRRPGPPMVRCARRGESYVFDGTAPWSTGWGLARQIVLGGTLDDGGLVYALTPADAKGLTASEPMKLCTMNASATVTLTCDGVAVGPERFIKLITREQLRQSDQRGMFLLAHLSHGVTLGSLRHLHGLLHRHLSDTLATAIERIESKLAEIKREAETWIDRADDPAYGDAAVRVRAASIALSIQAAQAAVIASAGSANSLDHPGQRLFREAMLFSLTAQTRELQAEMLRHG